MLTAAAWLATVFGAVWWLYSGDGFYDGFPLFLYDDNSEIDKYAHGILFIAVGLSWFAFIQSVGWLLGKKTPVTLANEITDSLPASRGFHFPTYAVAFVVCLAITYTNLADTNVAQTLGPGVCGHGWPITFLWRDWEFQPSGWPSGHDMRTSIRWPFDDAPILRLHLGCLAVDFILACVMVLGTAYAVEHFCRLRRPPPRLTTQALLAIVAWIATACFWVNSESSTYAFVYYHENPVDFFASGTLLVAIASAWFAAIKPVIRIGLRWVGREAGGTVD
jgi:hypothetical protein